MNSTSVGDIVAGIVIAWFIIKGLERLANLMERNADTKNQTPGEPSE